MFVDLLSHRDWTLLFEIVVFFFNDRVPGWVLDREGLVTPYSLYTASICRSLLSLVYIETLLNSINAKKLLQKYFRSDSVLGQRFSNCCYTCNTNVWAFWPYIHVHVCPSDLLCCNLLFSLCPNSKNTIHIKLYISC